MNVCLAIKLPFKSQIKDRSSSISDLSSSIFMSSPCSGVAGIEKLALSACGGLAFFTRCHSGQRSETPGGCLPATYGLRGQVQSIWGAGAAGDFFTKHVSSFCEPAQRVYH